MAWLAGAFPASVIPAGATTGFAVASPGTPLAPAPKGIRTFTTGAINALGSISVSGSAGASGLNNKATISSGYPWTTGMISVNQPAAVPPELFILTGMDARDSFGVGSISLVSGALSLRALSGPNANRGWVRLTLPEPAAALGAAGAFLMLGLCHGMARRRSSR
jgi:hypothetical protein